MSLVLPTLNEEETIGPIVRRAIREMVGRVPLLDEVVVIDSASTDRTREIAEAEGARVVQHPDVLTRYGSFRGKGESLWKSLYETSGDIIVWADTDVRNWHPRMVYGTLGPLLHEPRLQYVKGYYQRPIVEAGVLREGGGGRVTELVARPLINLFFPELSGFIQPLAGEYAGRRSILEQIPFFTGYAVEIGHLIDVAERSGLDGLGQVDLERRVHRNQELEGLLADELRDPAGGHEAARGAAQGATVRRARLDDEAAALRQGPALARGHRARRHGAPADGPDPGIPRASPGQVVPRASASSSRRTDACRAGVTEPLRVVLAPDSFKGSLTSVEVATALAAGWRVARPDDELRLAPLADGGEGTLVAIAAAGGWDVARGGARRTRSGGPSGRAGSARRTAGERSWSSPRRRACPGSRPPSATPPARRPFGHGPGPAGDPRRRHPVDHARHRWQRDDGRWRRDPARPRRDDR